VGCYAIALNEAKRGVKASHKAPPRDNLIPSSLKDCMLSLTRACNILEPKPS